MRKSRFHRRADHQGSEGHAAGLSAAELCRKYGVSEPTFYKWAIALWRDGSFRPATKALEEKNRQLKKLLAEPMLDAATLKEMLGKPSNTQLAETTCDLALLSP